MGTKIIGTSPGITFPKKIWTGPNGPGKFAKENIRLKGDVAMGKIHRDNFKNRFAGKVFTRIHQTDKVGYPLGWFMDG
jgi:hypothetical protein